MIEKIISGGQTGADMAALDTAIDHEIPHGGWLPKGRLTENGPLPEKYQLQEMATENNEDRTEKNILAADATLIVSHGRLKGGTELTGKLAQKHCKPLLHIDMSKMSVAYATRLLVIWLQGNGVRVLNVAGPRESEDPLIYDVVRKLLGSVCPKKSD